MSEQDLVEKTFTAREIVIALYRSILQRDPEQAGLEAHTVNVETLGLEPVVEAFVSSPEFRGRLSPPSPDMTLSKADGIQLGLSDDDRAKLWDHIGRAWTSMGETDPYWSVLANPKFKGARVENRAIVEEFYESGVVDIRYLDAFLERNGVRLPKEAVVAEFGCGVGRVTRWLARRYARVLAFDISGSHLAAARERLTAEGLANVELVKVAGPQDLARLEGVDLFFSMIVLQHNPPPIMAEILERACEGLKPGGVAFFQAPTYAEGYAFDVQAYLNDEYNKNDMEMHFLPQREIFRILQANKLEVIEVRRDGCIGHFDRWISNTFLARKR